MKTTLTKEEIKQRIKKVKCFLVTMIKSAIKKVREISRESICNFLQEFSNPTSVITKVKVKKTESLKNIEKMGKQSQ